MIVHTLATLSALAVASFCTAVIAVFVLALITDIMALV